MHLSVLSSLCFGALVALGSPIVHRRDTDLNSTGCDDYCAGTRPGNTKDDEVYVCKDWRLGPVAPPSGVPVDDIVGKYYRRFGGLCPGEFLKAWTNQTDGRWAYPPEQGFSIDTTGSPICSNLTLGKGDLIDRFGDETGDFVAPAFTPYAMRSIPPSNLNTRDAEYPYGYHVKEGACSIVCIQVLQNWFQVDTC
ncbi:hypothetical protein CGLO_08191 [Colletotrichum gloeosporioides Cg-14]|uniref:TNT domain-containing protein n=1 Tax=Colletotrichum gloeosporioides (strain Cg-14) TaxID=1237896 RepID=T0LKP7_COLGC|nr:hypothetical protein CGLO_08191 [Colletotrichum gloeosporioides Cg-14]